MSKKFISTSLMLAVLASGKTLQPLLVSETKATLDQHLFIWSKTLLIPEQVSVRKENRQECNLS